MHLVRFQRREHKQGEYSSGVRIIIDGRDLVELVREVELPFADAEGHSDLAGKYAGLPPTDVSPPSRHLFGNPRPEYDYDGRTQILGCECGVLGCWPLICRITVGPSSISWSEFEQPHRSGSGKPQRWEYDLLGPFRFDRKQYEQAIMDALAG
jgi:hypothetical protein